MLRVFAALLLVVTLGSPAQAVKYVKWNAPGPVHDGSSWTKAYLTIQEALDVAVDGERVLVAGTPDTLEGNSEPGATYPEKVVFKTVVTMEGGYRGNPGTLPDLTRDPGTYITIIDGGESASGARTVTAKADASIDGFTIRGAETAVYINTGVNTVFTVTNNIVENGGAYGIQVVDAAPTIRKNMLDGSSGGVIGIYLTAAKWDKSCLASVSQNTLQKFSGAGIYCHAPYNCTYAVGCGFGTCSPIIQDNAISDCQIGIHVSDAGGVPQILNNVITGHHIDAVGIQVDAPAVRTKARPRVKGNRIEGTHGIGINCRALYSNIPHVVVGTGDCAPTLQENVITGNATYGIKVQRALPLVQRNQVHASGLCGLYAYNDQDSSSMIDLQVEGNVFLGQGTGINCNGVSLTLLDNVIAQSRNEGILCQTGSASVVNGNQISGGAVGIRCAGTSATHTSPKVFRNTVIGSGIGVLCQMSDSEVNSNVFAYCSEAGVGIQGGSATLFNNTIAKNTIYGVNVESGTPQLFNNIVSGNDVGYLDVGETGTLGVNCFWQNASADYYPVSKPPSDISVDPMYLAPAFGEFHLKPGSPCIGAGSNDYVLADAKDADGKDRILPGDGTVDLGAFEWEDPAEVPYWIRKPVQAKVLPSEYLLEMRGMPVTEAFADAFYVQAPDRSSGLRVELPEHEVTADTLASFVGTIKTNADGERCFLATSATCEGTSFNTPLGISARQLGGGPKKDAGTTAGQDGTAGGIGVNNIGQLVRVWGKVTAIDPAVNPAWFRIDDGSGRQVRCVAEDTPIIDPLWLGKMVVVTGISSCEHDGANLVSKVLLKKLEDPVVH